MIHNQKEGYEILIGRHYEGANDDNRVTARTEMASEAVRFGVDKDKLVRILNLK